MFQICFNAWKKMIHSKNLQLHFIQKQLLNCHLQIWWNFLVLLRLQLHRKISIDNRCACNQTNASSEVCGDSNTRTKCFKLSQTQKVVENHDSDEVVDKNTYVHFMRFMSYPSPLQQNPCRAFTKLQKTEKCQLHKCCHLSTKEQISIQQVL